MQHHGFDVATPTLLKAGTEALGLPLAALDKTCSLNGRTVSAVLEDRKERAGIGLSQLAASLDQTNAWPRHPWKAHRIVAMIELLPALYLQARGAAIPKWRSFEVARNDFREAWWPYDVLHEVRQVWPRLRRRNLERSARLLRNPWVTVAGWCRGPARLPAPVDELLTDALLEGLKSLAATMQARAR
jgi:hypothetical protein